MKEIHHNRSRISLHSFLFSKALKILTLALPELAFNVSISSFEPRAMLTLKAGYSLNSGSVKVILGYFMFALVYPSQKR